MYLRCAIPQQGEKAIQITGQMFTAWEPIMKMKDRNVGESYEIVQYIRVSVGANTPSHNADWEYKSC